MQVHDFEQDNLEDADDCGTPIDRGSIVALSTSTSITTPVVTGLVTAEQLIAVLPPQMKKTVNQELLDNITNVLAEPDMHEAYRENLLSYTHVLKDGKYRMDKYINAVKYVSHKLRGASNIEAFIKTFPDRYQDFTSRNVSSKDIASYVTAYNKTKLVNAIYEQTMIPSHILNQDIYQEAINMQANLMRTAKSEQVRMNAADSLLNHLKTPETVKMELDIGVKENGAIDQLRQASMELAAAQRLALQAGVATAKQMAEQVIVVDVEAKTV